MRCLLQFHRLVPNLYELASKFHGQIQKIWNASRICVSSLRRGHANLLCIVPILVYVVPKQLQSLKGTNSYIYPWDSRTFWLWVCITNSNCVHSAMNNIRKSHSGLLSGKLHTRKHLRTTTERNAYHSRIQRSGRAQTHCNSMQGSIGKGVLLREVEVQSHSVHSLVVLCSVAGRKNGMIVEVDTQSSVSVWVIQQDTTPYMYDVRLFDRLCS